MIPPLFSKVEMEFTRVNCARLREDLAEHFGVWLKRGVKRVASRFHRSLVFLWEKEYTSELFCVCLCFVCQFVCFFGCTSNKMGYGLVKPRVVRSCVVYVRKTSNFGPMYPKLDWPEHPRSKFEKKWLVRHVAAKPSKRIQKSIFFCGKNNTHPSYFVFVQGLQENASSDGDDIGIARLLMATAAMKNQTDRFYTTAIVFAGGSVYTTLFEPPPSPQTMA